MTQLLLVMGGGALGAACRYGVNLLVPKGNWASSTTVVNILGSFCAVWVFTHFSKTESQVPLFAITGFMGAFTTYSAFSLETMQMLHGQKHSMTQICVFVLLNVLGSLFAAFIAWKLFVKA